MRIKDQNGTWNYPWWFFSTARFNPGGPTWYGEENRLPADMYLQRSIIGIISAALTFLFVLFVILPIIKHRLNSVTVAVNSITVGVVVSLCLVCPEWIRGHDTVQSPIYYHSKEAYEMALGVHIGLTGFNVSLRTINRNFDVLLDGRLEYMKANETLAPEIFYNERVELYHPEHLDSVVQDALERGLPVPLLTVYQCLTSASIGFDWSHRLVEAGYHCYLIGVFALAGWFLNQVLIAAIPKYSAYGFVIIGYMMILNSTVYFYWAKIYLAQPCIVISDTYIQLHYGICFWASLVIGVWSCIYGLFMAAFDSLYPDRFLTIFDFDYDHKRALSNAQRYNQFEQSKLERHVSVAASMKDQFGNDAFIQMTVNSFN